MENVRSQFGYFNGFNVSTNGLRGGLGVAWKLGGAPRDERRMEMFRGVLEDYYLVDVDYSGSWYTWERRNLSETNIRDRLSRGVANERFLNLFPKLMVRHLTNSYFDHYPLIQMKQDVHQRVMRFHFEEWWVMEEFFEEEVRKLWGGDESDLFVKHEWVQNGLRKWAKSI
ncbi:uncharacterized protein LOC108485065 [Gossypium arboreum]|uniref:uncharacterized protein LOC108485065 n=1 Tax=Gossypium arboreum TaxID=29729 RepID=UPI0008194C97|nr:uncharacterized protein LOC108485065 [Gossypium arboreum]